MKVLCVGDVHWSQNSSIVRSRGATFSTRLENLIASVNWAEDTAWNNGCSAIIYMGDFFDSTVLNSEEISALSHIQWAQLSHIFITGNHETNVSSLEYSTADIFGLCPNACVIRKPECYNIEGTDVEFAFLPYILERDRMPLESYFPPKTKTRIIFSHNDLKDVQYGPFLSTEGFSVNEIEQSCDLFMNGHIHNCAYVTSKIINCGNLTGQNFTEDATIYDHFVELIDIDDHDVTVTFIRNPNAFRFFKLDLTTSDPSEFTAKIAPLQNFAVATIRVRACDSSALNDVLATLTRTQLVEKRIIIEHDSVSDSNVTVVTQSVDHLKQFEEYVLDNIGDTNIIRAELLNIMR